MAKLILLDDEGELREEVAEFLSEQGLDVIVASCIQEFRQIYAMQGCDIAIIDRMLPDGDGMDLVSELRQAGARCGIVIFSARDASQERITGYDFGADHYVTKPVRLVELGAIVSSLARRLQTTPKWELNIVSGCLRTPAGDNHKLTGQESAFLCALAQQPGKAMSRRDIVAALGKNFSAYDPRNLDALVKRLRNKVDTEGQAPLPVRTVHGAGYLLAVPLALVDRH